MAGKRPPAIQGHLSVATRILLFFLFCYSSTRCEAFVGLWPSRYRTATSRSVLSAGQQQLQVYSLSLNYTDTSSKSLQFSKAVQEVWRWKDEILGDGRDFFIPKPKTLAALNRYLLSSAADLLLDNSQSRASLHVKECLVLSNCARFEVLLLIAHSEEAEPSDQLPSLENHHKSVVTELVSQLIMAQVGSYKHRRGFPWTLMPPGDWPAMIDATASTHNAEVASNDMSRDLQPYWETKQGIEDVLRHWSLISAGLQPRPRRPDRAVVFRPFSSRDAHILLQLKRTLEIQQQLQNEDGNSSKLLSIILQTSLSAGKAARNPNQVPELEQLREYGTGNSKYDQAAAPISVQETVVGAVRQLAIEPAVRQGMSTWRAKAVGTAASAAIVRLRQQAEAIASNEKELAYIRRQLHKPTIRLRNGDLNEAESIHLVKDTLRELALSLDSTPKAKG